MSNNLDNDTKLNIRTISLSICKLCLLSSIFSFNKNVLKSLQKNWLWCAHNRPTKHSNPNYNLTNWAQSAQMNSNCWISPLCKKGKNKFILHSICCRRQQRTSQSVLRTVYSLCPFYFLKDFHQEQFVTDNKSKHGRQCYHETLSPGYDSLY